MHFWITVRAYNIVIFIQIFYTLVYSFRALFLYRKRLDDFFSSLDGKSLRSNYVILISLIISCLFSLIIYNIGRTHFNDMPLVILLGIVCWGWVLNFLGFQVASLKYSADDLAADLKIADLEAEHGGYTREGAAVSGETNGKRKIDPSLVLRFNRLVDNDKIYLQPELRLDNVARIMCTNRTYISRLLNEEYQCTFSDFINCKRIAYAQSLMRSNRQMSQEQIALASGFLHASSFCRIFKQYTGATFREWQRKHLSL